MTIRPDPFSINGAGLVGSVRSREFVKRTTPDVLAILCARSALRTTKGSSAVVRRALSRLRDPSGDGDGAGLGVHCIPQLAAHYRVALRTAPFTEG